MTRTRTRSQHHLQRSLTSLSRERESVMRLVLHRPRLVEEASVVDVVGGVEMHPATKEVRESMLYVVEDVEDMFII